MNGLKVKQCSHCETFFNCGDAADGTNCWCNAFPPIFELIDGNDCLCADCFKNSTIERIETFVAEITPENAENNKASLLPKTTHLIEEIDYYIENGNYVFTKWFHLKRGACCGNGCRHCPYS